MEKVRMDVLSNSLESRQYSTIQLLQDKYYNKKYTEDYNTQLERLQYLFPDKYPVGQGSKILCNVTIQVTEDCNLRCSYCYQIAKTKKKLKFETAKKFIDILLDPDQSKNKYINTYDTSFVVLDFIGGEPLLEIDLITDICRYFTKRVIELNHPWRVGYMFSIGTNGVLYFDPKVQAFIDEFKGRVSFSITLDGDKQLHDSCRVFPDGSGSYDLASAACVDWMHRLGENGIMSSKLTIAPGNVQYLSSAIIHMISLGYTNINENCVYEEGWTVEHANILYNELKKLADYILENDLEKKVTLRIFDPIMYSPMDPGDNNNWCGGDGSMIALDVNGDIFNCIRYMESSLGDDREPLVIGNVEDGISCTNMHTCNVNCMRCVTRRSQSTDECFNCPIAKGCGWCSAYNYQKFGTVDHRATYICDMHKAEALGNAYYWNKLLIKHNEPHGYKIWCPKEWALQIISEYEYNILYEMSIR